MSQKVAYVTGGMGGIGTAICQKLAKSGFKVIAGCGPSRDFNKWLDEQKALGFHFYASVGNVADWASTVDAFGKSIAEHGQIDVLVNNAGTTHKNKAALDVTEDEFDRIFRVNVKGLFWAAQAVLPIMVGQGAGCVVNVASTTGVRPGPGLTWYSATKAAMINATKGLALEMAAHGVRVNAVNPMPVHSRGSPTCTSIVRSKGAASRPRVCSSRKSRDSTRPLADYLADPPPDTVLVFQASRYDFEGEDKARMERILKFYSAVPAVIELRPWTPQAARSPQSGPVKRDSERLSVVRSWELQVGTTT